MKKQKKPAKSPKRKVAETPVAVPEAETPTRRDGLLRYRNRAIGLSVIAVGGWFVVKDVQATVREHDLNRIGNGVPTVVQIHDPNCSVCAALQKEARAAMSGFEETELQFLVANIRDARGSRLAAEHGVPHVTLLLFDGDGQRREILRGPNDRSVLEPAFRQFARQHR